MFEHVTAKSVVMVQKVKKIGSPVCTLGKTFCLCLRLQKTSRHYFASLVTGGPEVEYE